VSTDRAARNELIKLGSSGVPVTVIDGAVIVGFVPEQLTAALSL